MITPIQSRVLVKLKGQYENLETTDERFGTSRTRGEVVSIAADIKEKCHEDFGLSVGDTVYFGKYEDTAPYGSNQDLVLIKLEDISGVSTDGSDD